MADKAYYVDIDKISGNIKKLVESINSPNVSKVYEYLKTTDFFSAPGSSHYHHSYEGGLMEHCSEVFININKLESILSTDPISMETKFILAFCHDLSKTNYYVIEKRNKYVFESRWERVDTYSVNDQLNLGHEFGSVYLLNKVIPDLSTNIIQAILFHHGAYNQATIGDYNNASRSNPLVFLLHTADMMSAISGDNKMDKVRESRGW